MDEFQQVMLMVQKYFPAATVEEVEPIYAQIKKENPEMTVDQIEDMMKQMIPQIQKKMGAQMGQEGGVPDQDAKLAALQAMRG